MSLQNVKHIVLVLSGKGGVGKSSITTQLALSLCLAGHSVGILDVDLTGPSIPRFLGIEAAKVTQAPGGWLPVPVHEERSLPRESQSSPPAPSTSQDGVVPLPAEPPSTDDVPASITVGSLHAMSLAFLLASRSSAIVWRGPKKTAMVRQFLSSVLWPPTDFLLIDTPPGTSDEHISLVETLLTDHQHLAAAPSPPPSSSSSLPRAPQLAGAVIVTTPQAVAVSDVRKELNFCAKTGVRVLGVVENMSGYVCECCGVAANLFSKGGGEIMARDFGVRLLGSVPVDAQWGALVEEGGVCVYEKRASTGGQEDDSDEDGEAISSTLNGSVTAEEQSEARPKDPRPLVERYRTCSLAVIFEEIARQLVDSVEQGTAVLLDPGGIQAATV